MAVLQRQSEKELHATSRQVRRELGTSEWQMGVCLLVSQQRKSYRRLGYSSLDDYAERGLQLSRKETFRLLSTVRALMHLPQMFEAYHQGELSWSKLRSLQAVATPETEGEWLAYARAHSSDEVARKVATSPREWKRQQGLQASLESAPIATPAMVVELLEGGLETAKDSGVGIGENSAVKAEVKAKGSAAEAHGAEAEPETCLLPADGWGRSGTVVSLEAGGERQGDAGLASPEGPAQPPFARKRIRVTFELTPDQFVLYETAERRLRDQARRHLSRAAVLTEMARTVLSAGDSRSRARYQILVHSQGETAQPWYESTEGPLPVGPEVLELARTQNAPRPAHARTDEASSANGVERQDLAPSVAEPSFERGVPSQTPVRPSSASGGSALGPVCPTSRQASELFAPMGSEAVSRGETSVPKSSPHDRREAMRTEFAMAPARNPGRDDVSSRDASQAGSVEKHKAPTRPVARPGGQAKGQRTPVPAPVVRALYARANSRCEKCGGRSFLQIHHKTPVSEGGTNRLEDLELLCSSCHEFDHEKDYFARSDWEAARRRAVARGGKRRRRSEDEEDRWLHYEWGVP